MRRDYPHGAVPEPAPGALWAAGGAVTIRGRSARAVWNPSPVLAPVISAAVLVADVVRGPHPRIPLAPGGRPGRRPRRGSAGIRAAAAADALEAGPPGRSHWLRIPAARSEIVRHSARLTRRAAQPVQNSWRRALFAEPEVAALSILRAATDPAARGGHFYGAGGRFGLTGPPVLTRPGRAVRDRRLREALWTASQQLTGV